MTYPGNTPAERYAAFRASIEPELLKKRNGQESEGSATVPVAVAGVPPETSPSPPDDRGEGRGEVSKLPVPIRKSPIANRKSKSIWDEL